MDAGPLVRLPLPGVTSSRQLQEQRQRLLADERGTLRKVASLPVALCYPSPYHVGMSSLGFQTIYREIHAHPDAGAERAFLPDDVEAFRQSAHTALHPRDAGRRSARSPSSRSRSPTSWSCAGLFELLTLAGLPVPREERRRAAPADRRRGPAHLLQPEPLEPFVDVLVQGEAEELIHVLLRRGQRGARPAARSSTAWRDTPGFWVPGRRERPRFASPRRTTTRLPARSQIVTPHTELRSMFLIEPERGCSRGCHYCVMRRTTNGGMRTVPTGAGAGARPRERHGASGWWARR